MIAVVSKYENGKPIEVGTIGRFITAEYRTRKNLMRYGVSARLSAGDKARVEIFHSRETIYGPAVEIVTFCKLKAS